VAAGNAHLNAIVICGGLIEHECSVLLRTKQVGLSEAKSGWRCGVVCRRKLPPDFGGDLGHDRESPVSVAADPGSRSKSDQLHASRQKALLFPSAVSWRRADAGLANKSRSSGN
jgi:hypothetical protein